MGQARIIEAYIQKLLDWDKPLDKNTLATISKEVGISPAEMHAVKRQAMAHISRGRNYLKSDSLDDAIDEFTQAMKLDPLNLDLLHALANAYNQRYTRANAADDRQKALLVAKRCVALKPNDKEALVLISFLEHTPNQSQKITWQWTKPRVTIAVSGLAVVAMGLLGVSRLPVFSTPDPLGPAPGTIIPGSVIYEASETDTPKTPRLPTLPDIDILSDVDIPVIFDYPGIVLEARFSQLGDYQDAIYYQLHGVFINASDQEIRKLDLNAEFLDRTGVAIAADETTAIGPTDAVIRPGDTYSFNFIQEATQDLHTVKLNVVSLEKVPARNTYVPPTPINYSWESLPPDEISFELASRSEYFNDNSDDENTADPNQESDPNSAEGDGSLESTSPPENSGASQAAVNGAEDDTTNEEVAAGGESSTTDGSKKRDADNAQSDTPSIATQKNDTANVGDFNAEWVLINSSNYPLRKLKLRVSFYNSRDRRLQIEEIMAVSKNDAPLLSGEIRPFRVIKSIPSGYERYQVTVLEAK
ncbi:MAG: hypothetical protein AAF821_17325 [Cyanobacteria bacterium P01_D01_bin.156]